MKKHTHLSVLMTVLVAIGVMALLGLTAFGACILEFDPNGGVNPPPQTTVDENETIVPDVPEYEGHEFLGWATEKDATVPDYAPGEAIRVTEDIVFHAIWKETVHGYKLKYDANGGKGAPEFEYGAGQIHLSTVLPTRKDYTFKGWAASATATSAAYQPGASFVLQGSDKTLYAVWASGAEAYKYTLTYDCLGGSDGPEAAQVSGDTILSATVPKRSGYLFAGWDTERTGRNAVYQPGDVIRMTKNVLLYAVWISPSTYTAAYHSRGGTGSPAVQTGSGSIKLSSVIPTRVGYHFVGWGNSMNATKAYFFPGQDFNLTYNIDFYAVWSADSGYTITFNNKGGSGGPDYQIGIGEITLTNQVPTRSGFTFMGWGTSQNAGTAYYFPGGTFYLARDITFYAVWSNDPGYKLTYNANGGYGAPPEQRGRNQIILSTAEPYREGYTFMGWGNAQNASKAYYFPGGTFKLTYNITLYAVWEKNAPADPGDPGQTDPTPANICHWCGKTHDGFLQKIIGFFHNILATIFGKKY